MPTAALGTSWYKTREEAEKLKAQIAKGADFARVAKNIQNALPAKEAETLESSSLARWLRHSIRWFSKSQC